MFRRFKWHNKKGTESYNVTRQRDRKTKGNIQIIKQKYRQAFQILFRHLKIFKRRQAQNKVFGTIKDHKRQEKEELPNEKYM